MKPGAVIGGLILVGGAVVLWSLVSSTVSMPLLVTGLVLLIVAFVILVKELMKI